MRETSPHTCLDSSSYILTRGGLVRTFKTDRPDHTMHLWLDGGLAADGRPADEATPDHAGPAKQGLIEVQVLKIEGDSVTIRFWAPDPVVMISAGKDPHCRPDPMPRAG